MTLTLCVWRVPYQNIYLWGGRKPRVCSNGHGCSLLTRASTALSGQWSRNHCLLHDIHDCISMLAFLGASRGHPNACNSDSMRSSGSEMRHRRGHAVFLHTPGYKRLFPTLVLHVLADQGEEETNMNCPREGKTSRAILFCLVFNWRTCGPFWWNQCCMLRGLHRSGYYWSGSELNN